MKWHQLTPRWIKLHCDTIASTQCWIWRGYIQSSGYGQVYVEGKRILAHHLSWIAHKGEIPKGVKILHECDKRACCNPGHLFSGTTKENVADCIAKGRAAFQKYGFAFTRKKRIRKLSDDDVRKIRKSRLPQLVLSDMFDVSITAISLIQNGKRKQLVA